MEKKGKKFQKNYKGYDKPQPSPRDNYYAQVQNRQKYDNYYPQPSPRDNFRQHRYENKEYRETRQYRDIEVYRDRCRRDDRCDDRRDDRRDNRHRRDDRRDDRRDERRDDRPDDPPYYRRDGREDRQDIRVFKEARDRKDVKDARETRDARREGREPREGRDVRDAIDVIDTRDARIEREDRDRDCKYKDKDSHEKSYETRQHRVQSYKKKKHVIDRKELLTKFTTVPPSTLLEDHQNNYPSIFSDISQIPQAHKNIQSDDESELDFDSGDEQFKEKEWKISQKQKASENIHAKCILTTLEKHQQIFINSFNTEQIIVNDIEQLALQAEEKKRKKTVNILQKQGLLQSGNQMVQVELAKCDKVIAKPIPFQEFGISMGIDPRDKVWSYSIARSKKTQLSGEEMDALLDQNWRSKLHTVAIRLYQSQFVQLISFYNGEYKQ